MGSGDAVDRADARLPGVVSGWAIQLHGEGVPGVLRARHGSDDRWLGSEGVMNGIGAILAALVASAALFWFGTGLDPVWWVTWLAPLPVLWLAQRVPGPWAFTLAILIWLAGALNEWSFARADVGLSIPVVLAIVALPALAF